jgi:ribosomal protein S12 methylthiotransferase accessory factor YcaO
MNIAAWKYRNILSANNGPIARLSIRQTQTADQHRNSDIFEALAYLAPQFRDSDRNPPILYGDVDGTGSGPTALEALHRAISEAIERWAFHTEKHSGRYGFDVDAGTNGMAAFPQLWRDHARRIAELEALERWSLSAWWEGFINGAYSQSPIETCTIIEPSPGAFTAILSSETNGLFSYGFACAPTIATAKSRARTELRRNQRVIERCAALGLGTYTTGLSLNERRLLWFSRPDGHHRFLKRSNTPATQSRKKPKKLFDGEIRGDWSEYATVWRVLFEPVSESFTSGNEQYFLF